jgi:hypothetical protein
MSIFGRVFSLISPKKPDNGKEFTDRLFSRDKKANGRPTASMSSTNCVPRLRSSIV